MLLRYLGWLSFAATRHLGEIVGDLVFLGGGDMVRVTRANLSACFPELPNDALNRLARDSLRQTGRYAAEFGIAWRAADQRWKSLIVSIDGLETIDDAQRSGRGVLILVPHYGNWEMLNLFLGARYQLTALYDPPRIVELDPQVRTGRMRTGSVLVPTTAAGIRTVYGALKQGKVVALLPDQAPPVSAGIYAPFFGRPALTMTLAYRLARKATPRVVLGYARRMPGTAGFRLGFEVLSEMESAGHAEPALAAMNAAIERLVRNDPAQYQWEYKRFKRPTEPTDRLY